MLKFSDLRVDFKSFDNTLSSYMKLFPNSYMPLLIMFLSREGLLEVVSEVKDDDSKVLLSVTKKEVLEMMRSNISKITSNQSPEESYQILFGIPYKNFNKEEYAKQSDISILYACSKIVEILTKDANSYSLIYHRYGDDNIDNIARIIQSNSGNSDEKAALLFYWLVFANKVSVSSDDEFEFRKDVTCFEETAQRILSHSGVQEYWQPLALTRLILSQYTGGSVYNPFAGVASYHTAMCYGLRNNSEFENYDEPEQARNSLGDFYYGEEINELVWAIGKMRLIFYQMDSSNYLHADSTKEFEGEINNILCTPPFNMQVTNEHGDKEFADHFVLRRGLDMLADNGMMAVVVPMNFFRRKDTFDVRKDLISKHLLANVVYLPENVFSSTRISTAIIFVRKGLESDKVKFVDATKYNTLNVAAIANLIEHDQRPEDNYFKYGDGNNFDELTPTLFNACVCLETFEIIAANDYDLSPSNYFSGYIDIPEGYKLERLENLVSRREFPKASSEGTQIVVRSRDLAIDFHLPYIERVNLAAGIAMPTFSLLDIDEKVLLLSSIGDLRPSIIGPLYSEVYISPNILSFYLDDKKVDPEYLVSELSKDYVKEQLRLKVMGSVIHRIKRSDALKLQILVPVGKDFLKKEKEITIENKNEYLEKLGLELTDLKDRRHDEYVKMLRQRKHRLQQIMNEFAPAFAQLNKCRIKQGGVLHDNDIAAARTGETVGSYFDKLNNIVAKVEDLITNLVNKDTWGESNDIDIDDFVDQIPQSHFSNKYEIQVYHDRDYEIWEEGEIANLNDSRIVKMDKESLSTLFENIIANASKWGFNEDVRRDYLIRITVADGMVDNQKAVRITVTNNGSPIHESVDRSRFFEWGYGTGTGIGTSQLKDIVEHYGGTIKLNEYPDDTAGFCTEYEIVLPIIDND